MEGAERKKVNSSFVRASDEGCAVGSAAFELTCILLSSNILVIVLFIFVNYVKGEIII